MAAPDLSVALKEALPELRRLQRKVWYWIIGLMLGGFTWSHMLTDGFTRFHAGVFAIFVLILFFAGSSGLWLRARKEMVLLPAIAAAFDFSHKKRDEEFANAIPEQLLPRKAFARYTTDDSFAGQIAGHPISIAELTRAARKPGEDNTKTGIPDFQGLVFAIALKSAARPLMIADRYQAEAQNGIRPVLDPGDAPLRDTFSFMGAEYGLWAASDERQRGRRDLLQGLVQRASETFDNRAFLYSAAVEEGSLTIALTYRHNLFTLGGLFAGKARLMQDIRDAADELTMVIGFATEALRLGQGLSDPAR